MPGLMLQQLTKYPSGGPDLTFATRPPRLLDANVKSKAPLESVALLIVA
jgi:hypothetical protein